MHFRGNRTKGKKSPDRKKASGRAGDRLFSLVILAGIVVTLCLVLYPSFVDAISAANQSTIISTYTQKIKSVDTHKIKEEKAEAIKYNEYIKEKQSSHPFVYSGSGDSDKRYQNILNDAHDGVMGYIEIPEIDVSVPIGHGTDSDVLDIGAGHVYGTSVPVGGAGTHSVISAHTGLTTAKLFTDVNKLKKGDEFSIHVLNEVHYYVVTGSQVELPADADKYLQVQPGKDLVTLYTCTPYGINTHRLLVHARAESVEEHLARVGKKKVKYGKLESKDWGSLMTAKAIALGLIPVIALLGGLYRIFGAPQKRRRARKRKNIKKAKKEDTKPEPKATKAKAKHLPPDFSSLSENGSRQSGNSVPGRKK